MTGTICKLFIGILLTPDLKLLLEKNSDWKKHRIVAGPEMLRITPYNSKEYLGIYFEGDNIPWDEIASKTNLVRTSLDIFFPDVRTDKLKIMLFNQLMLT